MLRRNFSVFLALAMSGILPAAEKKPADLPTIHLQWSDLGPMITGHQVRLTLPDGTRVRGEALSVEPQALVLDIRKTSNRRIWPKGETAIPRASVSEFRLIKTEGNSWRVIGTVLAGVGGAALGIGIAIFSPPAGAAVAAGITGLGFWGGWESDHNTRLVTVAPDL